MIGKIETPMFLRVSPFNKTDRLIDIWRLDRSAFRLDVRTIFWINKKKKEKA